MDEYQIQWFSGTGKGGQHRNKHQNCCRVTHPETGITAIGTASRSRESNRKAALAVCKARVAERLRSDPKRFQAGFERVRTYHAENNLVTDHASGERSTYKEVVEKGNIDAMIAARRKAMSAQNG